MSIIGVMAEFEMKIRAKTKMGVGFASGLIGRAAARPYQNEVGLRCCEALN
jgi:hypothetical protein